MKTTYLIENISGKWVFEYFKTLRDAKSYLELLTANEYRIVAMRGPNFGEGWHMYQVTYAGRVFLKQAT